jgi:uncharacterized protein YndB with AHSA1/START domain
MKINEKAPVRQSKQIQIQAQPEQVWKVLTNIGNWTAWNQKITRASLDEPLQAGSIFRWKVNGAAITSTLHTVIPNEVLGWTGVTFGGSAIHNWYLEKNASGTLVRVEESMEGWLIGLFRKKMNADLEKDMIYWLESLKSESEINSMAGTLPDQKGTEV